MKIRLLMCKIINSYFDTTVFFHSSCLSCRSIHFKISINLEKWLITAHFYCDSFRKVKIMLVIEGHGLVPEYCTL